jgi:putative hydrolase of the HAD superfamily
MTGSPTGKSLSQMSAADRASWEGVHHWVFDLDNTLYPASCDIFPQIHSRMKTFVAQFLDIPEEQAFKIQKQYYYTYGTTLRGLMLEHNMPPEKFLDYVHDIDHSVIAPMPDLDRAIAALPGHKVVFTNGSRKHAENTLAHLKLDHLFTDIFAIEDGDYIPKPQTAPFTMLSKELGLDWTKAAFFEDSYDNLATGARLGAQTVWVQGDISWTLPPKAEEKPQHHYATHDLVDWLNDLLADVFKTPLSQATPFSA